MVNASKFLIKCLEAFSFSSQYGTSTKVNGSLSSKRSDGIISESWFSGVKNWCMTLFKNILFVWYAGLNAQERIHWRDRKNLEKRWSEHTNPTEKNEPVRHLPNNIGHLFAWQILIPALKDQRTRKTCKRFS